MRFIKALVQLQEHAVLRKLNLNDISRYARLIGHLKDDILLPQPLDQTDISMPPELLSSSVAGFLSDALEIDEEYIQDSWDILKFLVWECEMVALIGEDYDSFREFGWSRGIGM
jgi:hypothetical protein